MSKQFVNDVVSIAILATCWHEVPMPPLEGEVPNEREAEGFVRKLSKKTPQSARSGCQLPFQGSQGGFAARVARLATLTSLILLTMRSYIFNSCNRRAICRLSICDNNARPGIWGGRCYHVRPAWAKSNG